MEEQDKVVTMDSVRIEKEKLSEVIKKNRGQHEADYKESVEAYKVIVVNKMREKMQEAEKNHAEYMKKMQENLDAFQTDWNTAPLVNVKKPSNHLEDYDTAIGMLEYSLDNIVHLDRIEFQSYVMDKWSWKDDFETTKNAMISGSAFYSNTISR